jgi:primase-polymerase (primpol)-like protein
MLKFSARNKPAPRLGSIDLDDADLLAKAGRATNDDKLTRLWAGDMTGYSSHSEADLALCSHLAFYCGAIQGVLTGCSGDLVFTVPSGMKNMVL